MYGNDQTSIDDESFTDSSAGEEPPEPMTPPVAETPVDAPEPPSEPPPPEFDSEAASVETPHETPPEPPEMTQEGDVESRVDPPSEPPPPVEAHFESPEPAAPPAELPEADDDEPPLPPPGEDVAMDFEPVETPPLPPEREPMELPVLEGEYPFPDEPDEWELPQWQHPEARPEPDAPDDEFMRKLLEIGYGPIPGDDEGFVSRPRNVSEMADSIEDRIAALSAREVL